MTLHSLLLFQLKVLSGIYIELDILEPYSTDPLNVPTVSATIQALRKVADSGFSVSAKYSSNDWV